MKTAARHAYTLEEAVAVLDPDHASGARRRRKRSVEIMFAVTYDEGLLKNDRPLPGVRADGVHTGVSQWCSPTVTLRIRIAVRHHNIGGGEYFFARSRMRCTGIRGSSLQRSCADGSARGEVRARS